MIKINKAVSVLALLLPTMTSAGFADSLTPAQTSIIQQCGQALQKYDTQTMPAAETQNLEWCFKNNACEQMDSTLLYSIDNCSLKLNLWKAHSIAAIAATAATSAGGNNNPPTPPKEGNQKNDKSTWDGYTATPPPHHTTTPATNKNTQQQKNQTNKKEINWY